MWRKNRNPNNGHRCKGVDVNRNFDSHWGEHASSDPCSSVYHGSAVFSELESQAQRSAVIPIKDRIAAVYSFHSFGQVYVSSYGYTYDFPAEYDEMVNINTSQGEISGNSIS